MTKLKTNRNNKLKFKKRNKAEYYKYLQSPKWKEFREIAIDILGHNCATCGNRNNLQVHHKNYKNIFRESISDVMVLCEPCHKKLHRDKIKKNGKKSKYMRDPHYNTSATTYYPDRKINL